MTSHCGGSNDENDYERGWRDGRAALLKEQSLNMAPPVACPTCGDLWTTRGAMLAHLHRLECGRTHDDGTLWSASGFGYVAPVRESAKGA